MDSGHTYKLIAIDLDGTLLSPAGVVTPRTKAAIHQCLANQLLVCFATGRNWMESRDIIDSVEHYASAVFVGGAMVIDTASDVQLHRTAIEPALAAQLCRHIESKGIAALALQDDLVAGVDYLISGNIPANPATTKWIELTRARVRFVPILATHHQAHTVRVSAVGPSAQMLDIERELKAAFAERIYLHAIEVGPLGIHVLEIFDPSVNKWQGILHVAERHHVRPEEIIAIGDDLNDLHMLQNAGLGVAMGNARPEAKAVAKMIIGSNADDGLAEFLESLVSQKLVVPEDKFESEEAA